MKTIHMSEEVIMESDINSVNTCPVACALKEGYGTDWGDVRPFVHATTTTVKCYKLDPLSSKTINLCHTSAIRDFIYSFDNESLLSKQFEGGLKLVINDNEELIDLDEESKHKFRMGINCNIDEEDARNLGYSL